MAEAVKAVKAAVMTVETAVGMAAAAATGIATTGVTNGGRCRVE